MNIEHKMNGEKLREWQVQYVTFVIKYHPDHMTADDVEKAIKSDWEGFGNIDGKLRNLVLESIPNAKERGCDEIDERQDKLTTHDVLFGYCWNEQMRPADEVYSELYDYLDSVGLLPDEYFSSYRPLERDENGKATTIDNPPFPDFWRLAIFAVPGGSEGYYIHVGVIDKNNQYENVFLGKILGYGNNRPAVRQAYRIAEEINAYFNGY